MKYKILWNLLYLFCIESKSEEGEKIVIEFWGSIRITEIFFFFFDKTIRDKISFKF